MSLADKLRNVALGPLWLRLLLTCGYLGGTIILPVYTGLAWTGWAMWAAVLMVWLPHDVNAKWPLSTRIGLLAIGAALGSGKPAFLFEGQAEFWPFFALVFIVAYALAGGKWK